MTTYSVSEARDKLNELVDLALAGQEVLIRRGEDDIVMLQPRSSIGTRIDLDWLERNAVKLSKPMTVNPVDVLNELRDED
jgi:hypothetical protein